MKCDSRTIDLTGRRFGRLVVTCLADRRYNKSGTNSQLYWLCRCDCGVEKQVNGRSLRDGRVVSCGCYLKDWCSRTKTTHGWSDTSEYRIWSLMNNRCHQPEAKSFKDYGARGIFVCERWRHSFENFIADMGMRPSPKHQIERKDNNGPYSPENCTWATKLVQANNKRTTVWLEIDGQRKPLNDWSRQTGVPASVIHRRLRRGWSHKDAAFLPNGTVKVSMAERWRRRKQAELNPGA